MQVTREVILDLLPVYLAGEASSATRALIEEYAQQDTELAERLRTLSSAAMAQPLTGVRAAALPPDLELRSLRRSRALIGWQKWLFGLGIGFSALALTSEISFEGGRVREFHFLMRDYPQQFGSLAAMALLCWTGYFLIRRRMRTGRSS